MNDVENPKPAEVSDWWSSAFTGLLRQQWELLDAQIGAGIGLLNALAGESAKTSALESLEQYALERARKGQRLPPEVYNAPERSRIDWLRFPAWARPTDPELFEGSVHEG